MSRGGRAWGGAWGANSRVARGGLLLLSKGRGTLSARRPRGLTLASQGGVLSSPLTAERGVIGGSTLGESPGMPAERGSQGRTSRRNTRSRTSPSPNRTASNPDARSTPTMTQRS